jgi:hypothetical protein
MLLKINELLGLMNPLSGPVFLFRMSNMSFCKAPVRSVKAKTD